MLGYSTKLPFVGPKLEETYKTFSKISEKLEGMHTVFDFFIKGDWRFESA
jgi:hypothetical protein